MGPTTEFLFSSRAFFLFLPGTYFYYSIIYCFRVRSRLAIERVSSFTFLPLPTVGVGINSSSASSMEQVAEQVTGSGIPASLLLLYY